LEKVVLAKFTKSETNSSKSKRPSKYRLAVHMGKKCYSTIRLNC